MTSSSSFALIIDIPKLIAGQALKPLRLAFRRPHNHPKTQAELANLVDTALVHEIRAGYTHRFITLMFVTVGERIFCRRYQYTEPSWHSIFLEKPEGQIKLDKTIVNIEAHVPADLNAITPAIDAAYAEQLRQLGARFLLAGATEPRAHASTIELTLADENAHIR